MIASSHLWQFFAGLGFFLYAMFLVEESLKILAGRPFKKLLQKHTNTHWKSILVGLLATTALQSSSAVTLMLLAFVGSEIMPLSNALGIILGANLGTTFTGWLVAGFGFEWKLDEILYPILAVGTLLQVIFAKHRWLSEWGRLFLGFGLLFFGLAMMKSSVEVVQSQFSFEMIPTQNYFVFALFGFIFTAIVQSSSVTMVLTLTALNAQIIPLKLAAALIIGADLGTTITVILGGFVGGSAKRQVAGAHFIFNLITDSLALLLLPFLLLIPQYWFGDDQPLFSLVLLHSSMNVLGILLFYPFLAPFARLLRYLFPPEKDQRGDFKISPQQPEAAIVQLRQLSFLFLRDVIRLNRDQIEIKPSEKKIKNFLNFPHASSDVSQYEELKLREATILDYGLKIQTSKLTAVQAEDLTQFLSSLRHGTLSAKAFRDVLHDLIEFRDSLNDKEYESYKLLRDHSLSFYSALDSAHAGESSEHLYSLLLHQKEAVEELFKSFPRTIQTHLEAGKIPLNKISSLLNFHVELMQSHRFLLMAFAEALLTSNLAKELSE